MVKDLENLILYYLKNNKSLDRDFVKQIFLIMVREYDLEDYVSLEFNNSELRNMAEYDFASKKIFLAEKKIKNENKRISAFYDFNNLEKKELIYFVCLQAILHELDHALRYRNLEMDHNDYITNILKYIESYAYKLLKEKDVYEYEDDLEAKYKHKYNNYLKFKYRTYRLYYNLSPIEIIAEVNSLEIALLLARELEIKPALIKFLNNELCRVMVKRYLSYNNPLKTYLAKTTYRKDNWPYLEGLEIKDRWDLIKNKDMFMCLKDRLMLGYPVQDEVINTLRREIKK